MIAYSKVYTATQAELTVLGRKTLNDAGVTHVETIDTTPPGDYPDMWGGVYVLPVNNVAVTVGVGGEQEHRVLLQVDVNRRIPSGMGELSSTVESVINGYKLGEPVTPSGHKVVNVQAAKPREVGGFRKISVTIEFYLRSKRGI